jgi:uncharacterized membrane protein
VAYHGAFGQDAFGRGAEKAARFFGTPQYIIGQTIVVLVWIALNSVAVVSHWDPYPFILLNLAFSTQAAYAAPLILLAETRQAERDKLSSEALEQKHDEMERSARERIDLIKSETSKLEAPPRVEHGLDAAGQGADRAGRRSHAADPRDPDEEPLGRILLLG